MSLTKDGHLLFLNTEIEKLERRLAGYEDHKLRGVRHWPSYNRTIERKQRLMAERDRVLTTSLAFDSGVRQRPKSSKLKAGNPEVAKRRSLVRSNLGISAVEMCDLFEHQKVPLPSKWEAAGFKSWRNAYKHTTYRKRIDVLISKDRRAN